MEEEKKRGRKKKEEIEENVINTSKKSTKKSSENKKKTESNDIKQNETEKTNENEEEICSPNIELTPESVLSFSMTQIIDLTIFEKCSFKDVKKIVSSYGIDVAGLDRSELKEAVLEFAKSHNRVLRDTGVMERVEDKTKKGQSWGYLRHGNFAQSPYDIYISHSQMSRFGIKDGDIVTGLVRSPKDSEKFHSLLKVESINYKDPEEHRTRTPFEEQTPIYPNERISLEIQNNEGIDNNSLKIIDLFAPIGKGTRGLIVAPPKTGKTTLLKDIARSITIKYPNIFLIILLVDERPEEVTDIERSVINKKNPDYVKVVSSTFDKEPKEHIRVSNMVLEMSKRLVESGHDVVILLDSITRMARASNIVVPSSGKLLSGGIDPASLYMPKRFIGAARNIEDGGSLTILATALVDTGSRMDDAIFEEFKATGNMELVMDRSLAEKRIYPSVDIRKSGTRHDDLLFKPFEYDFIVKMYSLIYNAKLQNESEIIVKLMKQCPTSADFITNLNEEVLEKIKKEYKNE